MPPRKRYSLPTRRSSDLIHASKDASDRGPRMRRSDCLSLPEIERELRLAADRKSTRLNSSHLGSSYAVFCLKKECLTWPRYESGDRHLKRTMPQRDALLL